MNALDSNLHKHNDASEEKVCDSNISRNCEDRLHNGYLEENSGTKGNCSNNEVRIKNVWKFKREHPYAEINDLQNSEKVQQERRQRDEIVTQCQEITQSRTQSNEKVSWEEEIQQNRMVNGCIIHTDISMSEEDSFVASDKSCFPVVKDMILANSDLENDCEENLHSESQFCEKKVGQITPFCYAVGERSIGDTFISNPSSEIKLKSMELVDNGLEKNKKFDAN